MERELVWSGEMRSALIALLVLASPAMAEPDDGGRAEVYVEGMAGYGGPNQNLVRFAVGARLGNTDEGLRGFNLRLGATGHLANSELAFSALGIEAEGNYPVATSVRLGLRGGLELGTPAGGADHGSLVTAGAVVRVHDLVSLHLDGFRARPGDNLGIDNLAPRYGVMVGIGVAGNPHWYGWIALGVAALLGGAYGAALAGGG
jgi:hypothetical protein